MQKLLSKPPRFFPQIMPALSPKVRGTDLGLADCYKELNCRMAWCTSFCFAFRLIQGLLIQINMWKPLMVFLKAERNLMRGIWSFLMNLKSLAIREDKLAKDETCCSCRLLGFWKAWEFKVVGPGNTYITKEPKKCLRNIRDVLGLAVCARTCLHWLSAVVSS